VVPSIHAPKNLECFAEIVEGMGLFLFVSGDLQKLRLCTGMAVGDDSQRLIKSRRAHVLQELVHVNSTERCIWQSRVTCSNAYNAYSCSDVTEEAIP
jgi:hypothetical protein